MHGSMRRREATHGQSASPCGPGSLPPTLPSSSADRALKGCSNSRKAELSDAPRAYTELTANSVSRRRSPGNDGCAARLRKDVRVDIAESAGTSDCLGQRLARRHRPDRHAVGTLAKARCAQRYPTEILPLWAPWAPAVSPFGGGVPGMNGAFAAYAGGRAMRRVTPCPTAPSAGIAASGGAAAAGAGSDRAPMAEEGPREVTGMAAPWAGVVCGWLTCAARESAAM